MSLFSAYAASKIGPTVTFSSTSTATAVNLLTYSSGALLTRMKLPWLFAIYATVPVRLLQTPTASTTTVSDTDDFLLLAGTYWPMVVEGVGDGRFVHVIDNGGSNGSIHLTWTNGVCLDC